METTWIFQLVQQAGTHLLYSLLPEASPSWAPNYAQELLAITQHPDFSLISGSILVFSISIHFENAPCSHTRHGLHSQLLSLSVEVTAL